MKNKILAVLLALSVAGGLAVTNVSFAGNKAVQKACKGKKPGDMVMVGDKEVKCPEAKKK